MKRFLLLLTLMLTVTACSVKIVRPDHPSIVRVEEPVVTNTLAEPVSKSTAIDRKFAVLVDQTFESASGLTGQDWLKAIRTVRLNGNIRDAKLHIDLSRGPNDDGKGWSALGVYVAPVAQGEGFVYPDEKVYGKRLHFVNAEWDGNCKRKLAPTSNFGVLHSHDNSMTTAFNSVSVSSGDDGCDTGMNKLNLENDVNGDGLYIGFMPSDARYHAKVTLEYIGELTVSPF